MNTQLTAKATVFAGIAAALILIPGHYAASGRWIPAHYYDGSVAHQYVGNGMAYRITS
ncbi:hypothetical protein [Neosynechococcus sphagnicola]|uniref:hypothetical protein n=1 Tax=Neosynechococcus sphagnicola TaxID=1501145 RepID=UPI0012E0A133|nr:hypothetical protein [Neosynechococcus sphagnicola]